MTTCLSEYCEENILNLTEILLGKNYLNEKAMGLSRTRSTKTSRSLSRMTSSYKNRLHVTPFVVLCLLGTTWAFVLRETTWAFVGLCCHHPSLCFFFLFYLAT